MGICIYCEREDTLTREHVFPDFLAKRSDREGLYYSGSAERYFSNSPVIRDVCSKCNNELLGSLDTYAAELYDKYFHREITSNIRISYNEDLLKRWIVKVIFNAQRSFGGVYVNFLPYRKYMLGLEKSPMEIFLFGCVMNGSWLNGSYVKPRDFRVSDLRIPELELGVQLSLSHSITVNSFSLLVLSFLNAPSKKSFNRTVGFIRKNLGYVLSDSNMGELSFRPGTSKIDHVSHKSVQRYHNSYVFPDDGIIDIGNKKFKLTNFPAQRYSPIKVVDSKIRLITLGKDDIYYSFLVIKNLSKEFVEFSTKFENGVENLAMSKRATATVIRTAGKTYVTIHDNLDSKIPILNPIMGVHQTYENWSIWKSGVSQHGCIYVSSQVLDKRIDDICIHIAVPLVKIEELE